MASDRLTAVIISYRKNRLNNRLILGEPALKVRRGWRREIAAFAVGQTFAYERWRGDQYGTQDWRLFICETTKNGACVKVPGVMPGADVLLAANGKARVKRVLSALAQMEAAFGPLDSIPPWRWRRLHNDIATGAFDPLNI